jgi:hypothetical protein
VIVLHRPSYVLRSHHVKIDVRRLVKVHGSEAVFMARRAVFASREIARDCHWRRVLKAIEGRSGYRTW